MIRGNHSVLRDMYKNKEQQPAKFLAVCVRPIFNGYKNYEQIANFIIYYSNMGVDHIVIYNSGVATPKLVELIETAKKAKITIELRAWPYHIPLSYELMQTMNIEVCLQSLMGFYKYVAVVDLDELIVPQTQNSLPDFIKSQNVVHGSMIHAYIFKSAFFCPSLELNLSIVPLHHRKYLRGNVGNKVKDVSLYIMKDVFRSEHITNVRYKYIVRPEYVYEAAIHEVLLAPRYYHKYTNSLSY